MREFTTEEIRLLAENERRMDRGEQPYVMLDGRRLAVTTEACEHFELTPGQTINSDIFGALLRFNLEQCRREIELEKGAPS